MHHPAFIVIARQIDVAPALYGSLSAAAKEWTAVGSPLTPVV